MMIGRRTIVAGGFALAAAPGLADARPARPPGRFGHVMMDAGTGAILDARDADAAFIPASTTKSLTTLAALATLPPTTRFLTRVHASGPVEGGVLDGDLTLVGGGDAMLDTADLAQLAADLRATGLRRVTGAFRVTGVAGPERAVLNTRQPLQAGYNPAIGPLCLNFNRVLLRWRNGGGARRLTANAHADGRSIVARSVAARESRQADRPRHDRTETGETWTLPARDLARDGERWFPVRDPMLYAATVFRDLCAVQGIRLPVPERTALVPADAPLAVHGSDVAFAQIKKMMKYSNNLAAEMLGIAAAQRLGAAPATVEDAAQTTLDWLTRQGIATDGMVLENHSGLSTRSRLTPRQMADCLRLGSRRFGDAFASLHTTGKLRGEAGGLPAYTLRTKTGTMHFVRCLAGFVEVEGRRAVFAVFHADDDRRAALDARYAPYDEGRPPGGKRWLRRALDHENAILKDWIAGRLGQARSRPTFAMEPIEEDGR